MNSKNRLALDLLRDYANKKQEKRNVIRNLLMQANTSPNYKKLDARERELIFLIASKESHNEDATELNLKLNKLKEIKNKVLMSLGINPQDLELKYDCEQCKDTGIVHNEYCTCFKNKLAQLALKDSGLDKNNLPSLKDFNTNITQNENQKKELSSYKKLITDIINKFPILKISNLLILGETGVGKSYGTLCLTTEIIKKGYSASVLTAFEMTNLFLKYHTTIDAEKIEALSPILDPDLLVIDDLGTEPILKNVTLEYLYLIIAERMNKQKLTVITSNLSLSNILDRYGERIFSRLNNKELSAVIKLQGDDLRLKI